MTNKFEKDINVPSKIMVDGVNVSGCEHLIKNIECDAYIDFSNCCEGYDWEYGYCPNIENCYYKQLKRKEEECKGLWLAYSDTNELLQEKTKQLQAEKEKVKELEKDLKKSFEEKTKLNTIIDRLLLNSGYNQCTASAEDFEDIYQNMEYKREKFKEYKQALEKIKELCILSCDDCEFKNSRICENDECFCNDRKVDEILQKCEVLEDE